MADVSAAAIAFKVISDRLAREAAGDLQRELNSAINDAARPAVEDVYRRLPEFLPNRYAATLNSDMRVNISRAQQGVSIRAPERGSRTVSRRRLIRLNQGRLAHPLFGNRRHFYSQVVKPGFFDDPISAHAPQVRQQIVDAMHVVAEKLTRKV